MKTIKRTVVSLSIVIALFLSGLVATGHGYILTSLKRTYLVGEVTANINDSLHFFTRPITTSDKTPLPKAGSYSTTHLSTDLIADLTRSGSAAFIVVKDGQIVSENYFNGYHDRSKTNSFSMAKTVTTLLLGIAIAEGHIAGLDQKITDFIPEFANDPLGQEATIGQFSLMNSGYEWDEHYYTPFSPTVELYYGDDVEGFVTGGHFSAKPGTFWEYSSASTQIIGVFLSRALKKAGVANNLSDYLSEKIWQPMQMNDDASWHLDNNGMELVYCCLNTNARNYAKLGLLMLNNGQWQNQQLVPAEFIQQMIKSSVAPGYGLSTWLGMDKSPAHYWFSGHLGQAIINVPEHNMVIVRLGEQTKADEDFHKTSVPRYIQMGLGVLTR